METKKSGKRKCSFGISSFDLVGKKFSFEFPTVSRKLKTTAGSGLTLVIGLVATIATVMIGSKYFDTSSPTVTFSNEIDTVTAQNLLKELLIPPMTAYMEGVPLQANISRFVTIKAISTAFGFDAATGDWSATSFEILDYVDCKQLNDPYFNQLLSKIDEKNQFKNILKCPDFKGNSSLSEVLSDPKNIMYKYVWVEVYPCTLEDISSCASASEVNKLNLVLVNTKKTLNPSNYTHAYQTIASMEEIPISLSNIKSRTYLTKKTKISDLRNDFLGPEEKGEFLTRSLSQQINIIRPPQLFAKKRISLWVSAPSILISALRQALR